ncbi:MAG: hypothetical protein E6Q62_07525 [Nitrosomonas sp.]|nr:MAG: hypothetical protein E6Q62_07525 [Nitrosomonas sp.]
MDADFCVQALDASIQIHGCPEIMNTAQSAQFTSTAFIEVLQQHHIQISMDGKGCFHDNIFVERLWRTVTYEHLYTQAFNNLKKVRGSLTCMFDWYNQEHFHQELNNQTSDKVYYQKIRRSSIKIRGAPLSRSI